MIRLCLDLVAITIDGSAGSDVQDQIRDSLRNHKMTHAGMLVVMFIVGSERYLKKIAIKNENNYFYSRNQLILKIICIYS
jgi:hypothetical protein